MGVPGVPRCYLSRLSESVVQGEAVEDGDDETGGGGEGEDDKDGGRGVGVALDELGLGRRDDAGLGLGSRTPGRGACAGSPGRAGSLWILGKRPAGRQGNGANHQQKHANQRAAEHV